MMINNQYMGYNPELNKFYMIVETEDLRYFWQPSPTEYYEMTYEEFIYSTNQFKESKNIVHED